MTPEILQPFLPLRAILFLRFPSSSVPNIFATLLAGAIFLSPWTFRVHPIRRFSLLSHFINARPVSDPFIPGFDFFPSSKALRAFVVFALLMMFSSPQ